MKFQKFANFGIVGYALSGFLYFVTIDLVSVFFRRSFSEPF